MNWIRIATKMKGDPRIGAVAAACRVRVEHAVGLVSCVLMEFPDHARDGDVSAIPDVVLEQWAMWPGKLGTFAEAFRAHLCDETGTVRAWERHNGKALRKAEADIERKREAREARENGAKTARAKPAPSARQNQSRRQNGEVDETRRKETTATSSAAAVVSGAVPTPGTTSAMNVDAHVAAFGFTQPAHKAAALGYLRAAEYPDSLLSHWRALRDGFGAPNGAIVAVDDLGQALHEMRVAGARHSARTLGTFLTNLGKGPGPHGGDAGASAPTPAPTPDAGIPAEWAIDYARGGDVAYQRYCDEHGLAWSLA